MLIRNSYLNGGGFVKEQEQNQVGALDLMIEPYSGIITRLSIDQNFGRIQVPVFDPDGRIDDRRLLAALEGDF